MKVVKAANKLRKICLCVCVCGNSRLSVQLLSGTFTSFSSLLLLIVSETVESLS